VLVAAPAGVGGGDCSSCTCIPISRSCYRLTLARPLYGLGTWAFRGGRLTVWGPYCVCILAGMLVRCWLDWVSPASGGHRSMSSAMPSIMSCSNAMRSALSKRLAALPPDRGGPLCYQGAGAVAPAPRVNQGIQLPMRPMVEPMLWLIEAMLRFMKSIWTTMAGTECRAPFMIPSSC
jgi:hypothetical protein